MAREQPPLPESSEVVVIGGGVIGTSAAFHLAEAGIEVTLLERAALGSGSTSKAAGGVRAQFSDAVNIALGRRSLEAFRDFVRRPGWQIDFKQVGYLFVLSRPDDVAQFQVNVELQNQLGVGSRMLSPAQVKEMCPLLGGTDILAGAFSPSDGHATPESVVQGYAHAARAHGGHLQVNTEVLDIATSGAEITGVVTDRGRIRVDTIICAAGPWSQRCGQMVGIDLPVTPLRRQILFTEPIPELPSHLPMTIDFETTFYFHREGPGLLMGMSYRGEEPGFNVESTDDWIPELIQIAQRRAPRVAEAGIRGGWAGLYEVTPDHNAIIGEAPELSRFIYATGFSGHGFSQAPAVGEVLRDLVLRRPPFVDVAPLSVERFAAARRRPEFNIV